MEKHVGIIRISTVGVEFDDEEFRDGIDADRCSEPGVKTTECRGIDGCEVCVVDAGEDMVFTPLPIERERTGNIKEMTGRERMPRLNGDGPMKRSEPGTGRERRELIDERNLCGVRSRGHGEIGKATGLEKDLDFVVHPTVFSLGMGIVESPVAVDESVDRLAIG